MPTTNILVNHSWVKVADTGDSKVLITLDAPYRLEVATVSGASEPTVYGHLLESGSALTREVIGDGHIWARVRDNALPKTASALLVVTK